MISPRRLANVRGKERSASSAKDKVRNWAMIKVLIFLSTRRTTFRAILSQKTARAGRDSGHWVPLFALTM